MTALIEKINFPLRSLGLLLIPPRCLSCGLNQTVSLQLGLCSPCFELLAPNDGHRCSSCDLPIMELEQSRCSPCSHTPPPFTQVRAPYQYGGPLAEVIKAIKFKQRMDLLSPLAKLISLDPEVKPLLESPGTFLVPVPLGKARLRSRGHNQAALLARALGSQLKIPVEYYLRQTKATAPQSSLSKPERSRQLKESFSCLPLPKRPLAVLVDDVVTTGSTASACAQALLEGGAREVRVLSIARTLL